MQYTTSKIKKINDMIKIFQVSKLDIENIQLSKELRGEVEVVLVILYQNNY